MMHLFTPNLYNSISLEKFVLQYKLIPRKLRDNEKLKLFHRYWIEEFGSVKIIDIFDCNYTEYYCIRYGDKLNGCISFPVSSITGVYELLRNDNNLEDIKFGKSENQYTGAEIKYWILHSGIELNSNNLDEIKDMVENKLYHVRYNEKSKKLKLDL